MNLIKKLVPFTILLLTVSCNAGATNPGGTTNVPVNGVSLDVNQLILENSETHQFIATVSPENATNQNVTWSVSSGSQYVSVNKSGLLTAVAEGVATLTVKTVDGEFTDTCKIRVNPKEVPVTGVSVNPTTCSIEVEESVQLEATIYPNNATNKNVTWSVFSGSEYAMVTQTGLVTGLKAGNATIQAITQDGLFSSTCSVTIDPKVEPTSDSYQLFTGDTLTVGDYVAFSSSLSASTYTLSTTQNNNNRGTISASVSSNILSPASTTASFKVEEGTESGTYAFYDEVNEGYLYAASSTQNQLKTSATKTDNSSFKIVENTSGQIKLVAQGANTRNILKFNNRDNVFSCYREESRSSYLPYLFTKSGEEIYPTSISLSGSSEIALNEQTRLTVTYEPSNTNKRVLEWSSSDTDVAVITASGLITGLSEGKSTIKCKALKEDESYAVAEFEIEVKKVDVTGVTLNQGSVDLAAGKTAQLNATVAPSNASNKNVTWSSKDASIATVSTTGLVTVNSDAVAGQSTIITVTTEDGNKTATCTVNVTDVPKNDHTVLIYMCGADLESQNQLATSDLQEILSVSGQPEGVNIVIQTGGAKSWSSTYGINSSYLERWHVFNKKLVKDDSLTYASMGLSSTLQSFIEFGLTNYPAERVGLVLWNHGGGLQGVCYDEKKNDDSLLNYEVTSAVSNALSNCDMAGQKLEWIGYDACLMQLQDIAEMNSQYFNYMIASQESESGYGWDYDTWVDDLYAKKTTKEILKANVDGFITDNGGTSSSRNDQTLSYLDLSYASTYKTAWENMATQLKNKVTSSNKSSFNSLIDGCQKYADNDYEYYGLFDAKDFVNKLSSNSTFNPGSTYTQAVLNAHSQFVVYSSCGKAAGNSYGLCMYWAITRNTSYYNSYTTSTTNFSNWRTLVSSFGN